jgi:tetratricopeptide (TPR) repeat protein
MAKKDGSKKTKSESTPQSVDINVGGNIDKGNIIVGNNNVIYYYAADGEKRQIRTGWFYGHRYGDLENFTGRAAEMGMLDEWLENDKDNLLVLTAFGGFGKSALTWQWFNNRVDKSKWQTAVWWSFYEKESGFESFLAETLAHLGVEVKASARVQVNDLLEAMRGTNILIVLDGFERLLRQYGRMDAALQSDDEDADIDPSQRDCSSPLTETFLRGLSGAGMKSKVLMTTRLCPRALESADGKLLKGCREEPLSAFSPEDAVTYFHNEGIKATRAEVIEVCSAYGYHPLSLSLLVGLINEDHVHRGDIAAVKNLEIFEDVKARRHHVLERAYESLAPERRDLLSKMSCFRGSMEYAALKKVFPSPDLEAALLDLRKRGLLQQSTSPLLTGEGAGVRFDMHPIVRHYAYDKFAAPNKTDAHTRLVNYFEAVPTPQTVTTLEDLAPVIELYHHMVRAGNVKEALRLFIDRFGEAIHFQFGNYELEIELLSSLFKDNQFKQSKLEDESNAAFSLHQLANAYSLSGQPRQAAIVWATGIPLAEKLGEKKNVAIGLQALASVALLPIGALSEAERNHRRCIDMYSEVMDEYDEASFHLGLGRVLSYCGAWQEAEQEFSKSLEITEEKSQIQTQGSIWSYRAQLNLLIARSNPQTQIENLKSALSNVEASAIECSKRALDLADETAQKYYSFPRDYIRAYWLLGSAYRANNDLTLAEENLSKALNLCRQINMVDHEADILLDLARLRCAQGDFKDAQEKASEALMITERSGYVLQGADVNLFLASLALEGYRLESLKVGDAKNLSDKEIAKRHAEEAKKLATCDGPPYYYKVAYEEAERFLEKLNT